MIKARNLIIVLILVMISVLAGCSTKNASSGTPTTDVSSSTDASAAATKVPDKAVIQKVTVWDYFEGDEKTNFDNLVKKYNNSQSKYVVEAQYVQFAQMKKAITIGIAAGNDLPDIVQLDNPDHASFAAAGTFEDLTARINEWGQADKYFKGPLNSAMYQGKYYGLPLDSNVLALYYNKDAFKEAGIAAPPQTWDELRDDAKKLTKGDRLGLAISAVKSEEGTFQFLPWLLSTGANYDSMDNPEAVKSLEILTNLIKDGTMSKEVLTWTQADAEKQFASGKAAMMVNGPWNIGAVKADAPKMNWGIALIPKDKQNASVLGGENIAIIKGKNVDGAWDFMKFVEAQANIEEFTSKSGYFSPRQDVSDSSDFWKKDPYLKGFADQLVTAMPRGPHPKWPQISEAIQEAIQVSLSLHETPDVAMKAAAGKVKALLK
jgi:multiple sugar transport system substrate-binding protein